MRFHVSLLNFLEVDLKVTKRINKIVNTSESLFLITMLVLSVDSFGSLKFFNINSTIGFSSMTFGNMPSSLCGVLLAEVKTDLFTEMKSK